MNELNQTNEPQNKAPAGKAKAHHRVAARLKGVVKNLGIKPKKKAPKTEL